ncbi:MAG: D-cysteine desulfhydrase family protein [Phycisphaerae bacterium]|nr:D-cysteine desulfhydrase family protein [Phycisphaerae bacterium]MCZ2398349.1 D-cysteine desulfhydrase family protein [Phycisphaerae bacterium]NUQ49192.1 D-cysteine desulfhydrase family protein [Phycisphaerae bacterium]
MTPAHLSLASVPTPLVRAERLQRQLGCGPLWIKRDDLTGLELSGNKVRKLEFIAADALAAGCDTLVTEGTPQSNHCRATAAVCARLGLGCTLLLRPKAPAGPPLGNHLLDALFGAETREFSREEFAARREQIVAQVCDELRSAGRKPRWTPMGASEPLGCWGYMSAAAELNEQLRSAGVGECDVVVAVSSGATYAGLVLGRLLHGLGGLRVWAVPVSDDAAYHRESVSRLCEAVLAQFGLPVRFDAAELRFIDGFVGAGYAIPYAAAMDALGLLARLEGIVLDPVYTAKAFCALLDGIRRGALARERPAVFIHTGGIFSGFAWPEVVRDATG